jgi:hypothetical protein
MSECFSPSTNENYSGRMNENHPVRFGVTMAGIPGKGGVKGRSGPPGNQNAFRHGLAAIEKRQDAGLLAPLDESIRQQIMDGLISDKGGEDQVSTATRVLAEVIASDATWLMVFNRAIDRIVANNQKVRENPRGLSQLDGYKRGLVNSLTGNLQKFGLDRVPQVKPSRTCFRTMNQRESHPGLSRNDEPSRGEVLSVLFDLSALERR